MGFSLIKPTISIHSATISIPQIMETWNKTTMAGQGWQVRHLRSRGRLRRPETQGKSTGNAWENPEKMLHERALQWDQGKLHWEYGKSRKDEWTSSFLNKWDIKPWIHCWFSSELIPMEQMLPSEPSRLALRFPAFERSWNYINREDPEQCREDLHLNSFLVLFFILILQFGQFGKMKTMNFPRCSNKKGMDEHLWATLNYHIWEEHPEVRGIQLLTAQEAKSEAAVFRPFRNQANLKGHHHGHTDSRIPHLPNPKDGTIWYLETSETGEKCIPYDILAKSMSAGAQFCRLMRRRLRRRKDTRQGRTGPFVANLEQIISLKQGLVLMSPFGILFPSPKQISVGDEISPIVGWCLTGTFTNPR